ncbi:hypothetical protein ACO2KH_18660 [Leptospira terpstrae]|uniref:hypothetical protein n=1 Tax=Leptospira terpstrae TaxID=293075 RepID=UPI003CFEE624
MNNNSKNEIDSLLNLIHKLPENYNETTLKTIFDQINSDLEFTLKNRIAQGIIEITHKIRQTKRFIAKPIQELFYNEFELYKNNNLISNENLKKYFESVIIIILNLVPKEKDSGIYQIINNTNSIENKRIIASSVWKSCNDKAKESISTALDFGVEITKISK